LVDLAKEAFEKQVAPVRQDARRNKAEIAEQMARAKNGGCGGMLALVIFVSLIAVFSLLRG
jgi:hypothetical protein